MRNKTSARKIYIPRLPWDVLKVLRKHHIKTNKKKEWAKQACRKKLFF